MPIKNYTTVVDVYKSLGEIQGALASHGARQIMVEYGNGGAPMGVAFAIETPAGRRGFALPANIDGVEAVFQKQKVKADRDQAEKTGWRNLRDWVMAQMVLIEAGMVQIDEVFLPCLTEGPGERWLYRTKPGRASKRPITSGLYAHLLFDDGQRGRGGVPA